MELLADSVESVGYLLKDRVSDVNEFRASVRRVAEGGSAIDRAVVAQLVGRHRDDDPIADLTPREREVLELMAEGRSNHGIATKLVVTEHVVEKHIRNIFQKLHIPDDHRRVLAVLLPTLQLVSPSTSSGVPKTCPRRRRAARARGARTVFAGLSPRTRTRCIRTSSFAGRCSDVRAARSFAGTFPRRPVGWIALQAGREMLFRVRSDNRSGRFAGISSPLTDSNRRPPPYHGGALPTELRGRVVEAMQSSGTTEGPFGPSFFAEVREKSGEGLEKRSAGSPS
jgi:DNA-binding CsgD family transcriptional regulator